MKKLSYLLFAALLSSCAALPPAITSGNPNKGHFVNARTWHQDAPKKDKSNFTFKKKDNVWNSILFSNR